MLKELLYNYLQMEKDRKKKKGRPVKSPSAVYTGTLISLLGAFVATFVSNRVFISCHMLAMYTDTSMN
jgi:hypothetical protein